MNEIELRDRIQGLINSSVNKYLIIASFGNRQNPQYQEISSKIGGKLVYSSPTLPWVLDKLLFFVGSKSGIISTNISEDNADIIIDQISYMSDYGLVELFLGDQELSIENTVPISMEGWREMLTSFQEDGYKHISIGFDEGFESYQYKENNF